MNDITLNTSKDMTNIINELLNSGISQTELDTKTQDQLIALCQANTSCNQNQLQNKNSQYLLITGYVPTIKRLPWGTRRWKKTV